MAPWFKPTLSHVSLTRTIVQRRKLGLLNLSDLVEVTQLGSDEVLEAKTPNRMNTPYISVIISCQVIEVIPLLSHTGDSRWLFTLSSSLC